jgi:hypothetical protein
MSVARSLLYAAGNLLHPRMLWLMLWPMLVAVALWGGIALILWTRLALAVAAWLERGLDWAFSWAHVDLQATSLVAANVLLFLAFVPLVYLTALFILSLFGMQKMVDHVATRAFPELERRHGGGVAGTVWNSLATLLGMLALAVLTLPLWLFPPLWPVIPTAVLGWVNQRLLRYDALAEHADASEMGLLFRTRSGSLYLLGVLLALAAYVPTFGFFAPVLFGLAFIHSLLSALAVQRGGR